MARLDLRRGGEQLTGHVHQGAEVSRCVLAERRDELGGHEAGGARRLQRVVQALLELGRRSTLIPGGPGSDIIIRRRLAVAELVRIEWPVGEPPGLASRIVVDPAHLPGSGGWLQLTATTDGRSAFVYAADGEGVIGWLDDRASRVEAAVRFPAAASSFPDMIAPLPDGRLLFAIQPPGSAGRQFISSSFGGGDLSVLFEVPETRRYTGGAGHQDGVLFTSIAVSEPLDNALFLNFIPTSLEALVGAEEPVIAGACSRAGVASVPGGGAVLATDCPERGQTELVYLCVPDLE